MSEYKQAQPGATLASVQDANNAFWDRTTKDAEAPTGKLSHSAAKFPSGPGKKMVGLVKTGLSSIPKGAKEIKVKGYNDTLEVITPDAADKVIGAAPAAENFGAAAKKAVTSGNPVQAGKMATKAAHYGRIAKANAAGHTSKLALAGRDTLHAGRSRRLHAEHLRQGEQGRE